MARKGLSIKTRFEVFKRDGFQCNYCGAKTPNVVLEVDHIKPVSKGGTNSIDNLLTSCFDCNRGKSNNELTSMPNTLVNKLEIQKEKNKQYAEFQKSLKETKKLMDADIELVEDIYNANFEGWIFTDKFKISVKKFIEKLGIEIVTDAMEKACIVVRNENQALKYFCGICWNTIKEHEE
jgi:formamidopyrimidine-DNA glycosylase